MTRIEGGAEPGYGAVAEAFAANFSDHGEVGAAFALYVDGQKVVDVWGGTADVTESDRWREDTLQLVFSTTKGATAACAHVLAQRGELDLEAPVATYWPEFAKAGKEGITVRQVLCHKAGLPALDRRIGLDEALGWEPVIRAIEVQEPIWQPGTAHGYHALTFGWLVGEIVRRITNRSLGRFFRTEIAEPLGLDFWIGLPREEQHRCARLVTLDRPSDPEAASAYDAFFGPATLTGRALTLGGAFEGEVWNEPRVRAAEVPAANGVADARSVARLYASLIGEVDGVRTLTREQAGVARETQTSGADRVLYAATTFGLGFMTTGPFSPYGGPSCFGHAGAGGSLGFADPDNGFGFGYVMNRMQANLSGDPRTIGLTRAVYEAIGEPELAPAPPAGPAAAAP
jgi:CubicO group peptidase (beta-lactamase class C family)